MELTVCRDSVAQKDARIAELEAQVAELTPVKAEVEQLRKEKADAELAAKRKEMTQFAERQGLDVKSEAVAKAIEAADYAALVAESLKQQPMPGTKPVMASYAMANGMSTKGEYDDLLGKA